MTQHAEAASHTTIASEYWKLYAEFVFTRVNAYRAEGERSMRECMSNSEEYDLDQVRRVVAHWAAINENGHEHRVAQSILTERLAELGMLADLGLRCTHHLKSGDILKHYGATLRLVERREYQDEQRPGDPTIAFTTECLHLDNDALMPQHWVDREGGFTIQGGAYARWRVVGLGATPELRTHHVDDIEAEYQAHQDELEAEEWARDCAAMKRAEQNFGY